MLNGTSLHVRGCILFTVAFAALCLSAEANPLAIPRSNGNIGNNLAVRGMESSDGGSVEKRQSSSLGISDNNGLPGPAPSTSVALIILYSVTGIITALFLLIIVTGAVRAHRHPDRYGPRSIARFGRPRQSRAKGLARAVLDTIPIVRFGASASPADEVEKPVDEVKKPADVEMQDRVKTPDPANPTSTELVVKEIAGTTAPNTEGDHQGNDEPTPSATPTPVTEGLSSQNQCPVCMEDFEQGQEVRVLWVLTSRMLVHK